MNQREHLSYGDLLSIELLKEEGLFVGRLMRQHREFPKSAATLSLVAMPYIAVIEHDAIPYLNKTFQAGRFVFPFIGAFDSTSIGKGSLLGETV